MYLAVVIVLLVFATVKFKLHPFLSLIIASLIIGFVSGQESSQLILTITEGFGSTLKSIGFIIAFGTIIGVYLEKSGGAKTMAESVLKIIGEKKSALAMNITGYIVSIPVFCDSGFIILSSLNKALSKRTGIPLAVLAIALGTGLYATHVFVPPTPGPLAAAATLNADIGLVIFYGLFVGLFSALSGLLWAKYSCVNVKTSIEDLHVEVKESALPNKVNSFAPILIPIILIALKSIADYPTQPLGEGIIKSFISFCGNPVIALFIGVALSFSLKKEKKNESHFDWVNEGLKSAGTIILITGAGGAFGNVLRATDLADTIGNSLSQWNVGIILPFLIAALLKTAQGSSTVAIITTAAIISPLLSALGLESESAKALTVLAIGAGSMTVSHINDSYFWVVSQFSGMNTSSALKTHTAATFVQGLAGIIVILILSAIIN
ncbi:MAG: GntP family permease [Melioribacteraceae bacterium]|nr:MAG: GntP family permease [Melioribacteraceae bacterium]